MKLNKIYKSFLVTASVGFGITSCTPAIDAPVASMGKADFRKYVAVGNSLTAGFADGGVYLESQQNSYPNFIAMQMKTVGGGEFFQPLFVKPNGSGYLALKGFTAPPANALPGTVGSPITAPVATDLGVVGLGADGRTPLYEKFIGKPNNNLGVPGIRVSDLATRGYGLNNPIGFNSYFQRLLPDGAATGGAASYLDFVGAYVRTEKPTFFTCWLGNNDVLGYATSGGVTPISLLTASTDPRVPGNFQTNIRLMLDSLTANGAKGVVATVPDVTVLPFLNSVTYATVRASLVTVRAGFKAAVADRIPGRVLPASLEQLIDGSMDDIYIRTSAGVRKATSADLFTLTSRDSLGSTRTPTAIAGVGNLTFPKGFSSFNPLDTQFVLDAGEVATANTATVNFNNAIRAAANAKNVPIVEAGPVLNEFRTGKTYNGLTLSTGFITGGLFSLDGVHLTPRGYAVIANEFIKTINASYGSTIPQLDVTRYPGVKVR